MSAPAETPAKTTEAAPAVDVAALQKELEQLRGELAPTKNKLSSLEKLLEAAKEDPDAILLELGMSVEDIVTDLASGKRKAKSKAEHAKAKEAKEIDELRAYKRAQDEKEAKTKAEAAYKADVEKLKELLSDDDYPLLRTLGLEPAVLARFYDEAKNGSKPDLKAVAKLVEDAAAGDLDKLGGSEKAVKAMLSRPTLKASVAKALGITLEEAAEVVEAVKEAAAEEEEDEGPTTKTSKAKSKEKPKAKGDEAEARRKRAIAALLSK